MGLPVFQHIYVNTYIHGFCWKQMELFANPIHVQTLGSKRHYLTENQEALETNSTLQRGKQNSFSTVLYHLQSK